MFFIKLHLESDVVEVRACDPSTLNEFHCYSDASFVAGITPIADGVYLLTRNPDIPWEYAIGVFLMRILKKRQHTLNVPTYRFIDITDAVWEYLHIEYGLEEFKNTAPA